MVLHSEQANLRGRYAMWDPSSCRIWRTRIEPAWVSSRLWLAEAINPQVRRWINYDGAFYHSELHFLARRINEHLVRSMGHARVQATERQAVQSLGLPQCRHTA